jgi:multimeric flavodoxin WrbA
MAADAQSYRSRGGQSLLSAVGGRVQVLAIIGSPRKGRSYRLTQEIEKRLTQNAGVRFEYVFLGEVNLQTCRGCYVCQSRGEQYCPVKDDRGDLVQRLQEADGAVFVSPVYAGNVSGLMKSFMDRLAYAAHRPAFLGKPAMLVATASSYTNDTLKALSWFRYKGFEIVSELGVPAWPSPRRDWRRGRAFDKKFEKAVRRFENALLGGTASLSLAKVIQFHTMKATAETDPAFFQANGEYYKDISQLNVKVSWWKKMLGRLTYTIASKWLNRRLAPAKPGRAL